MDVTWTCGVDVLLGRPPGCGSSHDRRLERIGRQTDAPSVPGLEASQRIVHRPEVEMADRAQES